MRRKKSMSATERRFCEPFLLHIIEIVVDLTVMEQHPGCQKNNRQRYRRGIIGKLTPEYFKEIYDLLSENNRSAIEPSVQVFLSKPTELQDKVIQSLKYQTFISG